MSMYTGNANSFTFLFSKTGVSLRAHQENPYQLDLCLVHIRTKYLNRRHQYRNMTLIFHYERQVC